MYSAQTLEEVKRDMRRLEIAQEPEDLKVYTFAEEANSLRVEDAAREDPRV